MNGIKAVPAVLWLAALLFAAGCTQKSAAPSADKTVVKQEEYAGVLAAGQAFGVSPAEGVYVTKLFSYTGASPENAEGKTVKNAAAVEIVNLSPLAFRCLDFTISCGEDAYRFFVTALPVGGRLTAVEKEGTPLGSAEAPSLTVKSAEPYAEALSLHAELFAVTVKQGAIEVKSRSAETLGGVTLYYKPCDENGFLGGMTRRLRFGELKAGETLSLPAPAAAPGRCKVLFTEYSAA